MPNKPPSFNKDVHFALITVMKSITITWYGIFDAWIVQFGSNLSAAGRLSQMLDVLAMAIHSLCIISAFHIILYIMRISFVMSCTFVEGTLLCILCSLFLRPLIC